MTAMQHFELKLDHIPTDEENDRISKVFGSRAISGYDLIGVGTIAVSTSVPTYEGARLGAVLEANKAGFLVAHIEDVDDKEYYEHFEVLERALADTFSREQLRVRLQILVWHHVRKTKQLRAHIEELEQQLNPEGINDLLEDL